MGTLMGRRRLLWSSEPEAAYDPSKIYRIEFEGKYYKFSGYGQNIHPLNGHKHSFKPELQKPVSYLLENTQRAYTVVSPGSPVSWRTANQSVKLS